MVVQGSPISPGNFSIEPVDVLFVETHFVLGGIEDALDLEGPAPVTPATRYFSFRNCLDNHLFKFHLGRNSILNKIPVPSLLDFDLFETKVPLAQFHLIGSPNSSYQFWSLELSLEYKFSLWRFVETGDGFGHSIFYGSIQSNVSMFVFPFSMDLLDALL